MLPLDDLLLIGKAWVKEVTNCGTTGWAWDGGCYCWDRRGPGYYNVSVSNNLPSGTASAREHTGWPGAGAAFVFLAHAF